MKGIVPLAAFLATACASSFEVGPPIPEPGDRVRYSVVSDTGRHYVGRAVRLSGDTIVIERLVPSTTGGGAKWVAAAFPTSALARLDKRIGSRGHAGSGALIGGGAGLVLGSLCAAGDEGSGFSGISSGGCFLGYTLGGLLQGALIGMLIKGDVWQPVTLPLRSPALAGDPAAATGSTGIGVGMQPRRGDQ